MVRANHTMLIEDNSLQSNTKPAEKPSIQSAMEAVLASSGWEDGKAISGQGKAKGSAGIFIDERADERQAEVLPRIFGGQVGGFPALVAALFAEGRQLRG